MKTIILLCVLLTLAACGVKGELSDESKNKTFQCTDTRDGESYVFNTNTIHDIVISVNDACFMLVDSNGVAHQQCKSHEVFLKCVEVKK